MCEENTIATDINEDRTVILDFSKLKKRGVIVVRLPEKLDLSNDLDRISTKWLMDANGVKNVKYRDSGTKLTITLTRKRRERPPIFQIIYSARHLMPYKFVTEMVVQFDRKHTNSHAFEELCSSLRALAGNEWMGPKENRPTYVIDTELLRESSQRVWVVPKNSNPAAD